ncbi:MAG: CRTAC1 family protein, partial [Arcobacter sp.]|nr:CRTAC1 family protein [Arcobacter sp.]
MKRFLQFLLIMLIISTSSCNNNPKEEDTLKNKEVKSKLPFFSKLNSEQTGIDFNNINKESEKYNVYEYDYFYNGGGVAVADFNNDNLQDIIFTANMSPNKIYINKGDFKFEDISETSNINVGKKGWTTGVTTLDINRDGFEDIYICRSGWFNESQKDIVNNLLFINNGDLTFTESAKEYGLDGLYYSTQACFFDFDNDGDLDLYLLNHPNVFDETGVKKGGKFIELPLEDKFSDQFYINDNNKFVNVTKKHGLTNRAHGLGVLSFDYNNDGYSDIFISNDYKMPNYILENQQGKSFKDVTDGALKHMAKFSMGCDFADINNDGYQDVYTVEMLAEDNYRKKTNMPSMNVDIYWKYVNTDKKYQDMHNNMQLNNTNGTFSEIAWLSNISETDWSWNPMFADFDNDGYQDIYVTNGFKRDINNNDYLIKAKKIAKQRTSEKKKIVFEDLVNDIPTNKVSNYIFSNNKDLTFSNKTEEWGVWNPSFSYGAAYSDLNNDGNLDIIVNNMNEEAFIFKNNGSGNKYIKFYLDNDDITAYGSKIEILDKDVYQSKELVNVHGFQSKREDVLHFGLSNKKIIDSILVTWFDNKQTLLLNTPVN